MFTPGNTLYVLWLADCWVFQFLTETWQACSYLLTFICMGVKILNEPITVKGKLNNYLWMCAAHVNGKIQ